MHYFVVVLVPQPKAKRRSGRRLPKTNLLLEKVDELLAPYGEAEDQAWGSNDPHSRWDYWGVGGRWEGWATALPRGRARRSGATVVPPRLSKNAIIAGELLRALSEKRLADVPFVAVTPDGRWHEEGGCWFALDGKTKRAHAAWLRTLRSLLEEHYDCLAVGVDCHV